MRRRLENPVASENPLHYTKPDEICPHCGSEIYVTFMDGLNDLMSRDRAYCTKCILDADSVQNRLAWIRENDLEKDMLRWARAEDYEIPTGDTFAEMARSNPKAAATILLNYSRQSSRYINWLMQTN